MRRYRYFQVYITLGSELLLWPETKYVKTRGLFTFKKISIQIPCDYFCFFCLSGSCQYGWKVVVYNLNFTQPSYNITQACALNLDQTGCCFLSLEINASILLILRIKPMRVDAEYPGPYSRKPATMCIRLIRSGYHNVDTRKLRVTLRWQKITIYEQNTLIELLHCGVISF